MDAPFNVTSFTAKKIEDQQARTVADVVTNDPSVRFTSQPGGILDSFFIRGFPIGEGNLGEIAFNGVYGVAPNYRVLTEYVERIEIIKGPAALLYGLSPNSGIGGTINIVPKRAYGPDFTRLTTNYASDTQLGKHLDVGRRFGAQREFGVRLNGSFQNGDTPLDNQSRSAFVGALALDYQGERFRASLDYINQDERFRAPTRPFLVAPNIAVPRAPDGRRNVTQPWEFADIHDQSLLLRGEYDLNDNLTLFADVGGGRTEVERLFGTPTILNSAGNTTSRPGYFKFAIDRNVADAGLRARFDTGFIRHLVTLQGTHYDDLIRRGSNDASQSVLSNIYRPVIRPELFVPEPGRVPRLSETTLTGVSLADTMSVFDERMQLTLGVRRQEVNSTNFSTTTGAVTSASEAAAFTPLVGFVVKPWTNVALYANYIEGLSKGDIAPTTAANAGEVLPPYIARQKEVGVKVDFGTLATTFSAFEIERPYAQLYGNIFRADSEQRNRGLEFNIFGVVAPGVRALAGATFLDAKLTRTSIPSQLGATPIGVPDFQANLSGEWDVPFIPGFTLTGNIAYTDRVFVDTANTQSIPAWARFDVGARFLTVVADRPVVIRASVLNVADNRYWAGVSSFSGLAQGLPRTYLVSASVDF